MLRLVVMLEVIVWCLYTLKTLKPSKPLFYLSLTLFLICILDLRSLGLAWAKLKRYQLFSASTFKSIVEDGDGIRVILCISTFKMFSFF